MYILIELWREEYKIIKHHTFLDLLIDIMNNKRKESNRQYFIINCEEVKENLNILS